MTRDDIKDYLIHGMVENQKAIELEESNNLDGIVKRIAKKINYYTIYEQLYEQIDDLWEIEFPTEDK